MRAGDNYLLKTATARTHRDSTLQTLDAAYKKALAHWGVNPRLTPETWAPYWKEHDAISKVIDPQIRNAREAFTVVDDRAWSELTDAVAGHPVASWLVTTFGGSESRVNTATVLRDHVSDNQYMLTDEIDQSMAGTEYSKERKKAVDAGIVGAAKKPKMRVRVDPHHVPPHWIIPVS